MGRQLMQAGQVCQQLGGISVGGWIVLSMIAGFLAGILATLMLQCYRRRKELRYLDKAPMVGGSVQPGTPAQAKPIGPLTAKSLAGPSGLMHVQLADSNVRSSIRVTDAGADINSRGVYDQRSAADVHAQATLTPQVSGGAVGSRQLSAQNSQPGAFTNRDDMVRASLHLGLEQQRRHQHSMALKGTNHALAPNHTLGSSPDSNTDPNADYQLPISMAPHSMPSPADSSPIGTFPHAAAAAAVAAAHVPNSGTAAAGHHITASMQHQQHQQHLPVAPARTDVQYAAHAALPLVAEPSNARSEQSAAIRAEASTAELEDEYDIEDLDADWKALLSDVDARLLAQGARVMNSRERSVAIKKLLVATGTRGVDFAMKATLDEIVRFRRFHGT